MSLIGSMVANLKANTAVFDKKMKRSGKVVTRFAQTMGTAAGRILKYGAAMGAAVAAFSLREFMAAEDASAKLAQVLKSTGGAVGLTHDQLTKMAESLQNVTTFEDDAIVAAQALMATFTQIRGDVFRDAMETVLNLSAALGQDLQPSVVQLGKALNDPIRGITALSKVGVSFTEKQREMIRGFVESGRVADAQRVILSELGVEFGGLARAMAQTTKGQLLQFKNSIGNLAESIGAMLAPAIQRLVGTMRSLAEYLGSLSERELPNLIDKLKTAGKILVGIWVLPKIIAGIKLMTAVVMGLTTALTGMAVAGRAASIATAGVTAGLSLLAAGLLYAAYGAVKNAAGLAKLSLELRTMKRLAKEAAEAEKDLGKATAAAARVTALQSMVEIQEKIVEAATARRLGLGEQKKAFGIFTSDVWKAHIRGEYKKAAKVSEDEWAKLQQLQEQLTAAKIPAKFETMSTGIGKGVQSVGRIFAGVLRAMGMVVKTFDKAVGRKIEERKTRLKEFAKSVIQQLKTPVEIFKEYRATLIAALRQGALTLDQVKAAMARRFEELAAPAPERQRIDPGQFRQLESARLAIAGLTVGAKNPMLAKAEQQILLDKERNRQLAAIRDQGGLAP